MLQLIGVALVNESVGVAQKARAMAMVSLSAIWIVVCPKPSGCGTSGAKSPIELKHWS